MATGLPASDPSYLIADKTAAAMAKLILSFVQAVQDDGELNSIAYAGLNSGIAMLNSRNWMKISGYQDIPLTVDQNDYELAGNVKDPKYLGVLDVDGNPANYQIRYRNWREFLVLYQSKESAGEPCHYTIWHDKLRLLTLMPAPSSAFVESYPTARLRHTIRFPEFLRAADTFDGPPEAAWFLIHHGMAFLARMRYPQKVQIAEFEASRLWEALKRDDNDTETDWGTDYR